MKLFAEVGAIESVDINLNWCVTLLSARSEEIDQTFTHYV